MYVSMLIIILILLHIILINLIIVIISIIILISWSAASMHCRYTSRARCLLIKIPRDRHLIVGIAASITANKALTWRKHEGGVHQAAT